MKDFEHEHDGSAENADWNESSHGGALPREWHLEGRGHAEHNCSDRQTQSDASLQRSGSDLGSYPIRISFPIPTEKLVWRLASGNTPRSFAFQEPKIESDP